MELEANNTLNDGLERLNAAVLLLERAVADLERREGEVHKIVAAVEPGAELSQREQELHCKLAQAEQQIAELKAIGLREQEIKAASARKTLPAVTTHLLAKQSVTALDSIEAGALDAALTGLSLEQRIAVKAQLLRAGALV
jgi:uncharacterized coiled-coil protein SlyX